MSAIALRKEEKLGLGVAIAAHLALAAVLMLQPSTRELGPRPERMVVSLAEEVGLSATAPELTEDPRASVATTLADVSAPPQPEESTPEPEARPVTPSRERPVPSARPQPRETAAPRPRETTPARPAQSREGGGSRIGSDFLAGSSNSDSRGEAGVPAARIGPAEQASLRQAINRQLKPNWSAPQGADAELLVTVLSWDLNEDGSLAGKPRVVEQLGINDTNRAQASRHAEQAIRAVQLAAPFDLPPQYYNGWKRIREWRFDRRLSQ